MNLEPPIKRQSHVLLCLALAFVRSEPCTSDSSEKKTSVKMKTMVNLQFLVKLEKTVKNPFAIKKIYIDMNVYLAFKCLSGLKVSKRIKKRPKTMRAQDDPASQNGLTHSKIWSAETRKSASQCPRCF